VKLISGNFHHYDNYHIYRTFQPLLLWIFQNKLAKQDVLEAERCFHCGENCASEKLEFKEKVFCCEGCKLVFELLDENNLCSYYDFNQSPGILQKKAKYEHKYSFLEDEQVKKKLIQFTDGEKTSLTLFLPSIHCSSCIYLLENLSRLNSAIIQARINFLKREIYITYSESQITLRQVVEMLAFIGYEPHISLDDIENTQRKSNFNRQVYYRLGVAGFCFGNIMLLSFPEYFSHELEKEFKHLFGYFNILLSLPVFFYSAWGFYISAWNGLKQKHVNIDVPIVLGIIVMFIRSIYEIVSGTGAGYMDSLAALIFFMLIGRLFQAKTYDRLSFERDYKSYFPVSVSVIRNEKETTVPINAIVPGEKILIRNQELIPADSVLISGDARIDYSFVTGESSPVRIKKGETIYAGGKQCGSSVELEVIKEVSQSYLTRLWNNEAFEKETNKKSNNLISSISRQFTITVILIAAVSAIWWWEDPARAMNAFTAVLIITCPCALALSTPFTLGNMLRIFGREKFYIKNAEIIETLAKADTIVFDKTGTITNAGETKIKWEGENLSWQDKSAVYSIVSNSVHPLSKAVAGFICKEENIKTYSPLRPTRLKKMEVDFFTELTGKGIEATVAGIDFKIGSAAFVGTEKSSSETLTTSVFISANGIIKGKFIINNAYRDGLNELLSDLNQYQFAVISGDNEAEQEILAAIFPKDTQLLFNQKPQDKLNFIKSLQKSGRKVIMIGDGLNDAGALKQSDAGIAVSDDINNFSPACDAIIDGSMFKKLKTYLQLSKTARKIILASFTISFLYNIVGLFFAVQGILSPVVAAIIMPLSTITIVLFTTVASNVAAGVSFKKMNTF
jgi:P-type Cu+ transporter